MTRDIEKEAEQASVEIVYKDIHGKRIEDGFILRVFHFIGARKKKHFMYKIASRLPTGRMLAIDISELYELGKTDAHSCPLECCSEIEILQDY